MATFGWIGAVEALSPAALTVRAQALSPNDNGRLLWDVFFPRRDVDSVDLRDVTSLDRRPAADRREWNGRGRLIPMLTPAMRLLSMVPIEAYDKIEEYEMQKLRERAIGGNAQQLENVIRASIPQRTDVLVESDYRRLEVDCFTSWATGSIVQRDPQTGRTYSASFGIDSARYQTAATAWSDPSVNAYNEFLEWYEDAVSRSGAGAGAMLRLATLRAILTDAPTLAGNVAMTRAQLADRISQDLGVPFKFFVNEQQVDVFTDGGTAVTRTKIWPAEQVAFVPAGNTVGVTAFAPVARAMEISDQVPEAGIDIRGVTVYHDAEQNGRELTLEAQLNAMPVPDPNLVDVIDAGV